MLGKEDIPNPEEKKEVQETAQRTQSDTQNTELPSAQEPQIKPETEAHSIESSDPVDSSTQDSPESNKVVPPSDTATDSDSPSMTHTTEYKPSDTEDSSTLKDSDNVQATKNESIEDSQEIAPENEKVAEKEGETDTTSETSEVEEPKESPLLKHLSEEEKKWVSIDENGQLNLKKNEQHDERKIGDLTEENAQNILDKLREQFSKVETEVNNLKTEFELQGDQVVLYPSVLHLLNYLNTVQALGNLAALISTVKELSKKGETALNQRIAKYKQILDKFKNFLAEEIESIRDSDLTVKGLHQEWKDMGPLPNKENQSLYEELKKLQDDYTVKRRERQHKDDLLQLNNLDRKKDIIQKAQEIAKTDEWKNGHNKMQALFKEWKSIGRVPLDQKDIIWDEFKKAKDTFYNRRKEFYKEFIGNLEENYKLKDKIVSEIEALQDSTDWQKTTQRIDELNDKFSEIGQVPKEKWEALLDRLHTAKRNFFNRRNSHYSEQRKDFDENLMTKTDLANRVDALKESTDWKGTTRKMNELFDQWKETGPTYRSKENKVWEKFISARKHFYDRKDSYFEELNKKQHKENIYRIDQEKAAIEQLKKDINIDRETLEQLKKDHENESNERFKSKIHETIKVLENKISNDEKLIKDKESWVKNTQKKIDKIEENEAKAKEKDTPPTLSEKKMTPEKENKEKEIQSMEKEPENSDIASEKSEDLSTSKNTQDEEE